MRESQEWWSTLTERQKGAYILQSQIPEWIENMESNNPFLIRMLYQKVHNITPILTINPEASKLTSY